LQVTKTVEQFKGSLTVDFLAREHNMTTRTMERAFKRDIGISPKMFIGIIKFVHTNKRIETNKGKNSLLRIAHEQGYYDHAHLSKEVKRFTGFNPSDTGLVNWHP
jgi:transcriptional regulator GlxA family with amidase domain